jgi:hypothetical protein
LLAPLLVWGIAATLSLVSADPAVARPRETGQAAARTTAASDERSQAVYPPQRIPLRFDHERHVAGMKMSCVSCHAGAERSRNAADRLLPSPVVCDSCHDADHHDESAVTGGACRLCHEGYRAGAGNRVARVVLRPANLRFDHAAHAGRNIGCTQCHARVARRTLATRRDLPTMERCLDCHGMSGPAAGDARGDCLVCHVSRDGRRMVTRFDTGTMLPPAWLRGAEHGPGWIERHRQVAAADSEFCATCHQQRECVSCHDGQVRPRYVHPGDWISMHATAARQQSTQCRSCHRQQTFCLSCHQRVGVSMLGPTDVAAKRGRYHPPPATWTDAPRTPAHHSWEAQRNMNACVSCHTERDCATCHATRAAGGVMPERSGGAPPHPPGFAASCSGPFRRNPRPCLVCHLPDDPELAPCR